MENGVHTDADGSVRRKNMSIDESCTVISLLRGRRIEFIPYAQSRMKSRAASIYTPEGAVRRQCLAHGQQEAGQRARVAPLGAGQRGPGVAARHGEGLQLRAVLQAAGQVTQRRQHRLGEHHLLHCTPTTPP